MRIDAETGELFLVHVEGFLENGRHLLFNGEIRLSLRGFAWIVDTPQKAPATTVSSEK